MKTIKKCFCLLKRNYSHSTFSGKHSKLLVQNSWQLCQIGWIRHSGGVDLGKFCNQLRYPLYFTIAFKSFVKPNASSYTEAAARLIQCIIHYVSLSCCLLCHPAAQRERSVKTYKNNTDDCIRRRGVYFCYTYILITSI